MSQLPAQNEGSERAIEATSALFKMHPPGGHASSSERQNVDSDSGPEARLVLILSLILTNRVVRSGVKDLPKPDV